MIRRYPFVIFYLLTLCGPLWGQPDFRWPVDMDDVGNLTGNLGEPRPDNIDNPTVHLHHWHKGIDIPKTNEETIRIPAAGKVTYVEKLPSQGESNGRGIVVLHHGIDGNNIGWHTRFYHIKPKKGLEKDQILRPEADGTMPAVGTVTKGHCHFEVYQFDAERYNADLYGNLGYVRNPLKFANLTATYPDRHNPTVAELQFNLLNTWNDRGRINTAFDPTFWETTDFLDRPDHKFLDPPENANSYPIYFLAQVYDDITRGGATGPYSVEFSIWQQENHYLYLEEGQYDEWEKVYTFKYQFDDLRDAEGANLQLTEVYANGTQANNQMFYFSKAIDLFWGPFNVNEGGEEKPLNPSGQLLPFRFQVDVTDKRGNEASRHQDILVPSPSHADSDILVDSFSAERQGNHVRIDFRVFNSEKVKGFNILRRSADESTFAPVHPYPLTIHPTSEPVDPWQSSSTLLSYEDGGLVPGETYFYALEVLWQSGRRDILEHLVTKVCVPDGGHITQQSQQSQKEIL